MYKYMTIILCLVNATLAIAEVDVSSKIIRSNRLTSSLISIEVTAKAPLGTSVKFPEAIEQTGITFLSRTLFPVKSSESGTLVSKVAYDFVIPTAGTYEVNFPNLSIVAGEKSNTQPFPAFKLEVLSRLPKTGTVTLPFIGKIEVNPQHNFEMVWVIMVIMATFSLVMYFVIKRRLKETHPSVLSKLWLLKSHNELTPALLRGLLLEFIGFSGGVYSISEVNAMISADSSSGFDQDRLVSLLQELESSAFSREGILSETLITDVISFMEENQVEVT